MIYPGLFLMIRNDIIQTETVILKGGVILKSEIKFLNDRPMIIINGKPHSPLAYTTYFDECGEWSDFIKSGYRMFFVNVSFNDLPINNITGFSPFLKGVFETDTPDYSEFDGIVSSIISVCPDALIFPRIHISMPRKWLKNNPSETVETESGCRESLYSDLFMQDGAELLKTLVSHIRNSDYADRIAGYHLCGGTTQEWIHPDLFGSYSDMGMKKFREWAYKKYVIKNIKTPDKADFHCGYLTDECRKYFEFVSEMTPKTIEFFARELKEFINNEQIIGVFYGYNAFVNDPLWGFHGLGEIIDSPYIDFFSSPCAYDGNRKLGIDWGDMIPVDSVRLHGKLCFIECDIRTHLTRRMQESRPGRYPEDIYPTIDKDGNKTAWSGPETSTLSVSAIRKAFSHQITKKSGVWWFDMWGGWYHDNDIMSELDNMRFISDNFAIKDKEDLPNSETVLFIDEKAYANIENGNHLRNSVNHIRSALGNTGIPFDIYMVEDAEKISKNFKAAIFSAPIPSENGKKAIEICQKLNIPFISSTKDKFEYNTNELRDFLIKSGVHCYNSDGSVIYCSGGFLGIHTVSDGETTIKLPKEYKIKPLNSSDENEFESDTIFINTSKHNTLMYELFKSERTVVN